MCRDQRRARRSRNAGDGRSSTGAERARRQCRRRTRPLGHWRCDRKSRLSRRHQGPARVYRGRYGTRRPVAIATACDCKRDHQCGADDFTAPCEASDFAHVESAPELASPCRKAIHVVRTTNRPVRLRRRLRFFHSTRGNAATPSKPTVLVTVDNPIRPPRPPHPHLAPLRRERRVTEAGAAMPPLPASCRRRLAPGTCARAGPPHRRNRKGLGGQTDGLLSALRRELRITAREPVRPPVRRRCQRKRGRSGWQQRTPRGESPMTSDSGPIWAQGPRTERRRGTDDDSESCLKQLPEAR